MKHLPNITFLRYFYSACQYKSVSKAAQENFVSQSAISQAISKLEVAFGKQLITHEKNRFQLTPEGQLLLDKCKQIFSVFSEIDDVFNEADGIYKGKLSFACTHSFALSLLPPKLGELAKLWPEIQPIVRFGHTGTIVELVKKGDVDFGIVLDNDDFSQFQLEEIYQGEHKLYKSKGLSRKLNKRFILSEERREISLLKELLDKHGIEIESSMEVFSWEVIANFTEQGLGVGFLPDYVAKKRNLLTYKCSLPPMPYRIVAIYSKHKSLSRNARAFIDLLAK